MLNSTDRQTRANSAAAISIIAKTNSGKAELTRAVPHLIKRLTDSYEGARFSAAAALGSIRDRRALPHLRRTAKTDSFDQARKVAQEAIKAILESP